MMSFSYQTLVRELEEELHELCQPLTALHFRLELGKSLGGEQALGEAIDGALAETARLIDSIRRMRERVTAMKAAERSSSVQDDLHPIV